MTLVHALFIAILQGATELFPVSSLGHAVILPALLGWRDVDQHATAFLPFLVMLHLGTSVALLGYFGRDWWDLAVGVLGLSDPHRVRESRRILVLIGIATVPAAIAGKLLEPFIRVLFASPMVAAVFLAVNAGVLLFGERLRGRVVTGGEPRPIAAMSPMDALVVGLWQCLALIPGLSRSGVTMVGGLLRGADHAEAAHFSFLIAPPIILGATLLQVPKLLHQTAAPGIFQLSAIAAVIAGVVSFASTAFLMRYFRRHDAWALNPFAYYCLAAGAVSLVVLAVGR